MQFLRRLREENGEDVAEYAVMLALLLTIALATIHFVGVSASAQFSSIASSISSQ